MNTLLKKFHPNKTKRHQKGISLLEVGLSVGVIALILVVVTILYTRISDNEIINLITTNYGALTDAEVRYANNNQGVYSTNTTDLVNKGYLSASLANCAGGGTGSTPYSSCAVTNPWGGTFTLATTSGGNGVKITTNAKDVVSCNQINEQNKTNMSCTTSSLLITKIIGSGT